jgi:two-component system, NarL family, sensor kinase
MPDDLERFPADMEIAVFRAVQECLTNVHRHSGCRSCAVKVFTEQKQLHVEVRDDGKGIPKNKRSVLTSSAGGVGLRGMQERIRQLGGTLIINSSEQGTQVLVTLPIGEANASRNQGAA